MAVVNLYVGGATYDGKELWRVQDDGSDLSIVASTALDNVVNQRAIAIGPQGGIFVGEGSKVHKFDNSLSLDTSWGSNGSVDVGGTVYGLALDGIGRLIVPHDLSGGKNARLLDSSGSEVWGVNVGGGSYNGRIGYFCVDGEVLVGCYSGSTGQYTSRRLDDLDGSELNQYMSNYNDGVTWGLVANLDDTKVYVAWKNNDLSSGIVRKYPINGNPSPSYDWTVNYTRNVYGLILHSNGYLYVCGGSTTKKPNVWKVDPTDGSVVAEYDTGTTAFDICEDDNGNIITAGYAAENEDGETVNINVLDQDLSFLRGLNLGGIALRAVAAKLDALTVPLVITDQSSSQKVLNGEFVELYVTVTGLPAPTYQWYKDDTALDGETNSTLSFYASFSSTGVYKCKISNAVETIWSNTMNITVVENPYRYNLFSLFLDFDRVG